MWGRTFVGGAVVDAADGRDVHEVGERAAVTLGGGGGQPADERVGAGREQEEEEEEEREEGGDGGGAHHRLENHRRMCTTDTPNLRKPLQNLQTVTMVNTVTEKWMRRGRHFVPLCIPSTSNPRKTAHLTL